AHHSKRADISSLEKRGNVFFLGAKPYEDLPNYMQYFDVCIEPRIAEKDIPPPTKVFDYLASGKPVVATNVEELDWLKDNINLINCKEDFLEAIKEVLVNDTEISKIARIKKAEENSWQIRAENICREIDRIRSKKKLLVLPTYYIDPEKMKIRIIELAKGLSIYYRTYLLAWNASVSSNIVIRALTCLLDLFTPRRIYKLKSLNMVRFPLLHRPLNPALKFNSYFLRDFIKREAIDIVLNGSFHMFSIDKKRDFKYVLDLADMPTEDKKSSFGKFKYRQTGIEAQKADLVSAVSAGLAYYIKQDYKIEPKVLVNGAYLNKFRLINSTDVSRIKDKYCMADKFIIGYAGMIGSWVDVDFLVKVFKEVKKQIPEALILLVGPCPNLKQLRSRYAEDDIIITGIVSNKEIETYINCFNLAVLPHVKNPYQDMAFHIKLIEYTAARKMVVSTPLDEVKRLNFPNIIVADMDVGSWAKALLKAKDMVWPNDWDSLVEKYDWKEIVSCLNSLIEGL
ncbi:MAG: glycosyltransferase, partial [Candidatus Omnitrophica bacterium]|nr:glycosyltransferase [Candidatus Omnitrophota bacterium]